MLVPFERWYALTPRWRCVVWLASSLLLLLGWWLSFYRPAQQQLISLEAQRQREAASHRAMWSAARKLFPPSAEAFTPLAFNANGLRLVRWQPAAAGGELVLDAAWAAIPALFSLLAQHDVAVTSFSVAPEQQSLQVVLQLERQNAG